MGVLNSSDLLTKFTAGVGIDALIEQGLLIRNCLVLLLRI